MKALMGLRATVVPLFATGIIVVQVMFGAQIARADSGGSGACVVGGSISAGAPAPVTQNQDGTVTAGVYCTNTTGHNGHPGSNPTYYNPNTDACLPVWQTGNQSWWDYIPDPNKPGNSIYMFYIPVQGVSDTYNNDGVSFLPDWFVDVYGNYIPQGPHANSGQTVNKTVNLTKGGRIGAWKKFFGVGAHDVTLGYWYFEMPFDPAIDEVISVDAGNVSVQCNLNWIPAPQDQPPVLTPPSKGSIQSTITGASILARIEGVPGSVSVDPPAHAITQVPLCAWIGNSTWRDQPFTLAPFVEPFTVGASNGGTYTAYITLTVSVTPDTVYWDWGDGTTSTSSTMDPGHSPGQHPTVTQNGDGTLQVSSPCPVQHTYHTIHDVAPDGSPINGGPVRVTAHRAYSVSATATWWDGTQIANVFAQPLTLTLGPFIMGQSPATPIRQIEGVSIH